MNNREANTADVEGFSLVEILVVLTILSLVAGIAGISVQKVRNGKSAYNYARELSDSMTSMRYRAMNTGRDVSTQIDIGKKMFVDSSGHGEIILPQTWSLSVQIGRKIVDTKSIPRITFLPDGTSSGAEITLTEADGDKAYVRVNWLTGLSEYSAHAF